MQEKGIDQRNGTPNPSQFGCRSWNQRPRSFGRRGYSAYGWRKALTAVMDKSAIDLKLSYLALVGCIHGSIERGVKEGGIAAPFGGYSPQTYTENTLYESLKFTDILPLPALLDEDVTN